MEIGIGLPATIPGADGRLVIDWARRAEERGFSTLGIVDRIAYDNYEPLVTLAAAAGATERIRLMTTILLAPLRTNHALFAKQVASVDRLSDGRLVLGLGVGRRVDDYDESAAPFHQRGHDLDSLLERATAIWRDPTHAIGPAPAQAGGPPLIFGGDSPAALARMATLGAGWIAGGGFGDVFRSGAEGARAAWAQAGREGSPRIMSVGYFALGDRAREGADAYLTDYYAFVGPAAQQLAAGAPAGSQEVARRVDDFAQAGADELILLPCIADLRQVDLLADAVGL